MKQLQGIVCAIITPMKTTGELDTPSLKNLGDYLVKSGIHGIYPTGTNGEGILLSLEERQEVSKTAVEAVAGRSVIMIQSTAATTSETLSHIRHAKEIGADGVGVMTPFFFGLDKASLKQFYKQALEVDSSFPIYAYNIPSHTSNDLTPEVFHDLVQEHSNLQGIKFSAPDLMRIEDYMRNSPRPIHVLIGCDSLILPTLSLGAAGTVSGPAMVFPKLFVGLYEAFQKGDYDKARQFQEQIVEMDRCMRGIPAIPAIKTMLKMKGIIESDTHRLPLRAISKEEYRTLENLVEKFGQ
jgi:4-hydroxy-tetrahydrodipicolinate synthase